MSITNKLRSLKKRVFDERHKKRLTKDVNDIRSWPPGTFILFDNREELRRLYGPMYGTPNTMFHGLGMVVANCGHEIHVIWAANCHKPYQQYVVDVDGHAFNPKVIHHVE